MHWYKPALVSLWANFYLCNYTPHSLRGAAESYTT